ncbi:MAG: hypothetical protein ACOVPA_20875 [Rubrivivax sp.]|jgi:hypothetical protein
MKSWQSIPEWSLLAPYAQQPHYADHFCVSVSAEVTIEQWAAAFFTSRAFRLERFLLNRFFPSKATDDTAYALGEGRSDVFSAWTVERRGPGQLLLKSGITRTWLAAAPHEAMTSSASGITALYLGSAVLGAYERSIAAWALRATLAPHRAYSQVLLHSGTKNLRWPW